MSIEQLDNLVKTRNLKREAPDQKQVDGMIESAKNRITDLQAEGLLQQGQFLSAYDAAHLLALAALRWHGYRSDSRYIVFQCLQHTVDLEAHKWRLLAKCHDVRNQAEYEGVLDMTPQLLVELIEVTHYLVRAVEALGPVKQD